MLSADASCIAPGGVPADGPCEPSDGAPGKGAYGAFRGAPGDTPGGIFRDTPGDTLDGAQNVTLDVEVMLEKFFNHCEPAGERKRSFVLLDFMEKMLWNNPQRYDVLSRLSFLLDPRDRDVLVSKEDFVQAGLKAFKQISTEEIYTLEEVTPTLGRDAELLEEVEELRKENLQLQRRVSSLEKSLEASHEESVDLRERVDKANDLTEKVKKENQTLASTLMIVEESDLETKASAEKLRQRVEVLCQENNRLTHELEVVREQKSSQEPSKQTELLLARNSELEQELDDLNGKWNDEKAQQKMDHERLLVEEQRLKLHVTRLELEKAQVEMELRTTRTTTQIDLVESNEYDAIGPARNSDVTTPVEAQILHWVRLLLALLLLVIVISSKFTSILEVLQAPAGCAWYESFLPGRPWLRKNVLMW